MSSSSGPGNGCCLDPHVIDHMTWSVKGVVRARILAPSRAKAEAGLAQGAILEVPHRLVPGVVAPKVLPMVQREVSRQGGCLDNHLA